MLHLLHVANARVSQCKTTKPAEQLLFCTSQADGKRKRKCRKKYCESCLRRSVSRVRSLFSVDNGRLLFYPARIRPLCSRPHLKRSPSGNARRVSASAPAPAARASRNPAPTAAQQCVLCQSTSVTSCVLLSRSSRLGCASRLLATAAAGMGTATAAAATCCPCRRSSRKCSWTTCSRSTATSTRPWVRRALVRAPAPSRRRNASR